MLMSGNHDFAWVVADHLLKLKCFFVMHAFWVVDGFNMHHCIRIKYSLRGGSWLGSTFLIQLSNTYNTFSLFDSVYPPVSLVITNYASITHWLVKAVLNIGHLEMIAAVCVNILATLLF